MTQFRRAEVYYCDFPSNNLTIPTSLPAPDYNLRGNHMAIMLTNHDNPHVPDGQALVVPISSLKDSVIRKDITAYIPLKVENNPFLDHNSYAKTNQIQPIDRAWIKGKVGDLNPKDMNMVNMGVLLATGTYKFVEQYIDQEVTKRVLQALGGIEEVATTRDPFMPSNKDYPITGDIHDFRRADVIKTVFPKQARNHVSMSPYRLEGECLAVCMTNHFNSNVPKGQVLVVPLLRADQVNPKNLDSIVPVPKKFHPYLDRDYFAQTNLIQPLNRHWIQDRIGQIGAGNMKDINVGVLQSTGSYRYIEQVIDREVSKRVFEAQRSKHLDRSQPRSTRGPGR